MASILPDLWSRLFSAELERFQRAKYNNNNKNNEIATHSISAHQHQPKQQGLNKRVLLFSRIFWEFHLFSPQQVHNTRVSITKSKKWKYVLVCLSNKCSSKLWNGINKQRKNRVSNNKWRKRIFRMRFAIVFGCVGFRYFAIGQFIVWLGLAWFACWLVDQCTKNSA